MAQTFTTWLRGQRERNDPVGDLARDAQQDICWPRSATTKRTYAKHLEKHGAIEQALSALDDAWKEWALLSQGQAEADFLAGYHLQLQAVYKRYPLARLLVESAARLERTPGHNASSCHSAYKDWLWAVFGHESKAFYDVLAVIDALIPTDHPERSVAQYNPDLPGLPARPARKRETVINTSGREVFRTYTMSELESVDAAEEQRQETMRLALEALRA